MTFLSLYQRYLFYKNVITSRKSANACWMGILGSASGPNDPPLKIFFGFGRILRSASGTNHLCFRAAMMSLLLN